MAASLLTSSKSFAPADSVPYLPDIARLERLCVQAFHAADVRAVAPRLLARALNNPDGLAQLHLQLHPGVAAMHSPYAIAALWATHQPKGRSRGLTHANHKAPWCCATDCEWRCSRSARAALLLYA